MILFTITLNSPGGVGETSGTISRGVVQYGEFQWPRTQTIESGVDHDGFFATVQFEHGEAATLLANEWAEISHSCFHAFIRLLALSPVRAAQVISLANDGPCFRATLAKSDVEETCTVFSPGSGDQVILASLHEGQADWQFSASCSESIAVQKVEEVPLSDVVDFHLRHAYTEYREQAQAQALQLLFEAAMAGNPDRARELLFKQARDIVGRLTDLVAPPEASSSTHQ